MSKHHHNNTNGHVEIIELKPTKPMTIQQKAKATVEDKNTWIGVGIGAGLGLGLGSLITYISLALEGAEMEECQQ